MLESDLLTNYFMRRVYFSSDDEDLALVRRSLAGDTEAFAGLVARYQRVMYTVALRMVGNSEDAQDATQDAFVKAFQRLTTFDTSYRFYSWMYRILINECINLNRGRHPEQPLEAEVAAGPSPFETTVTGELRLQIHNALLRLTPEYRTVVVLRHFAGQSYEEIAQTLAIPEKTVKSRLYTARQQLGEMLLGWKEQKEDNK